MSGQTIDYDKLAQQYGGKAAGADLDALAKQYGGAAAGTQATQAPPNTRDGPQHAFDDFQSTKPQSLGMNPWDFGPGGGGSMRLLQGAGDTLAPLVHPIQTLQAAGAPDKRSAWEKAISAAVPGYDAAKGLTHAFADDPVRGAGQLAAGYLEGEAGGGTMRGVSRGREAIREAALGGQEGADAAALKSLRIPSSSTRAARTLDAVEGARPFLKGTKSVAEAQERIPAAKAEIWAPYENALNKIGDHPVKGPDGMTTVRALEEERLQLSALNRGLRTGDPAALRLAEQQGITSKAEALEREYKIQRALDPELEKVGIKPREIRKAFGQVSQVGQPLIGRSTIAEPSQPYGFGRMTSVRLSKPLSGIEALAQGGRDVLAGRPWWSGKPSDVNIREAFRIGGEKPNFRAPAQSAPPANPLVWASRQLEANVPGNADDYGEDFSHGAPFGIPLRHAFTPEPPPRFPALPARAGEGESQPMIWAKQTQHPGLDNLFARERIKPNVFDGPAEGRSVTGAVTREGQVIPKVRGYLSGGRRLPKVF